MTCPISLRIKPMAQGTFQKEGQEVSAVPAQIGLMCSQTMGTEIKT